MTFVSHECGDPNCRQCYGDAPLVRVNCRKAPLGCPNYCMVDTVPPGWAYECLSCEAHEWGQDLERMAREDEARRAMLGRDA